LIIIDGDATTSGTHGCRPDERSIEQLLDAGAVVIDKPAGPNSHQVSAWARDILGVDKLGHGGTLDPFATGVLLLLSGRSMRLTKKVLSHDKTYIGVLRASQPFDENALERSVKQLSGHIYNVPPEISAVKIQVRTRNIETQLLDVDGRDAVIKVTCEAGSYIRTLARDLGLLLGHPIELKELRRTQSGRYSELKSITLQQLKDAVWMWSENNDESALRKVLTPIENIVADLPEIVIKDGAAGAISHGAPLLRPGISRIAPDINRGDTVRLITLKGELVAIADMLTRSELVQEMTEGEVAKPTSVFLEPGTYPRTWKNYSNN
tara:strand:- start:545 stop:1510 length:966 start_codon:yes stop_codon:yes gene_type:complete